MSVSEERPHRKPILALGTVFGLFLVLSVIIPAVYPHGMLTGLDGSVGVVDHKSLWNTLDPISSAIYTTGDLGCHQEQSRTLMINGSEMPFCIRETFLFLGLSLFMMCAAFLDRSTIPTPGRAVPLGIVLIALTALEWVLENSTGFDLPVLRAAVSITTSFGITLILISLFLWESDILERRFEQKHP